MELKKLRKEKKLSQIQLANQLNITQEKYSRLENGLTELNIDLLCKLADIYNVSIDYLCEHETKHLIDTSNWQDITKAIVNRLMELNEKNQTILFGYILHMLKEQNKQVG